ncbi:hypothetical protein DLAC_11713 [Tieghemostelium lacteum]|uniref:DUF167 domain-containing protein n=1 Tax=Tieghemostelium lacteum TaxID=361077 RepID=A0A151ZBH4_TIELA|nr:hypothetical protein DLAC_11713 [Tieghemostelium lacteum]|eukprot:KYQ91288.1 hypothetical protein DLAC_11713 [Tieghemostelium lacteum]
MIRYLSNKPTFLQFSSVDKMFKLSVNIHPNSKTSSIESFDDKNNEMSIKISEAPVDGKANKELIDFLSNV